MRNSKLSQSISTDGADPKISEQVLDVEEDLLSMESYSTIGNKFAM